MQPLLYWKSNRYYIFSVCVRARACVRVRALRRIFGPKRDEVTGEWRKLRNEELLTF